MLERLNDLTEQMVFNDERLAQAEEAVAKYKDQRKLLTEELIPEEMRKQGQDLLKLDTGEYIEIFDEIKARVPKHAADEVYAWLEENGEGGMVKRQVICEFRKDQEEEANTALAAIKAAGFNHAYTDRKVAWNTYQKWAQEQIADDVNLPREKLGIFTRTIARIKK